MCATPLVNRWAECCECGVVSLVYVAPITIRVITFCFLCQKNTIHVIEFDNNAIQGGYFGKEIPKP